MQHESSENSGMAAVFRRNPVRNGEERGGVYHGVRGTMMSAMVQASASGVARAARNPSPEQVLRRGPGSRAGRQPGVHTNSAQMVRDLRKVKGKQMEHERGAGGDGVDRNMMKTAVEMVVSGEQWRQP